MSYEAYLYDGLEDLALEAVEEEIKLSIIRGEPDIYEDPTPIWETKDGKKISIDKMTTSHILNCISYIQKHKGWREEFLPYLKLEAQSRGVRLL